jgi:hypothetical protein
MDIRYQDEIAAVTQRVDLAPGETKTTDLTSFCGNAHRSAPAAGAQYAIGEAENSRMRNLLATIEGRKQQDSPVGQWAVWTLTDNLSITPNDAALPSGWSSDAAAREILAGGPLSTSAVRWVILTGLARFLWWVLIPLILAALALWWWLSHRPQATAAGKPGARQGSVTPTQSLQKPVVGPSGADVTHGKGKPLKRAGRK